MKKGRAWERVALGGILCLELWVFSASLPQFFNLDSLYYLVEYPRSIGEFLGYLAGPDDAHQYRPLTLGLMGMVVPVLGNQPRPYHWIPLLFHFANTLLFYRLARRLLSGLLAVMAATAFWGLHSVAGWITYDISYLSDFLSTFLLLSSLLFAVNGADRGSPLYTGWSLLCFCLALLVKEAAVTFPLALWIALSLADLRTAPGPFSAKEAWQALRRHIPLVSLAFALSIAFAGLLTHWFRAGLLYPQGPGSGYNIDPMANLWGKLKYVYWALNLPDASAVGIPVKMRALLCVLMGIALSACAIEIARRKGKLSAAECGGLIWFGGLCVPALMLSDRLAKWYLYAPLLGLSLVFGVLTANLYDRLYRWKKRAAPAALLLAAVPVLASSVAQTRSHIAASEPSYVSNVLQAFLASFRNAYPWLPARTTLFVLPAFEGFLSSAVTLLTAPPISHGELFEIYYPGTKVRLVCAERGERLSPEELRSPDTRVLHYLDGRIIDVTSYFKEKGRMILHVLPTSEGEPPPLLREGPLKGGRIYDEFVTLSIADQGARLPRDYFDRSDIWFLQYMEGRFCDVTPHYMRRSESTLLLLPTLDGKVPPVPLLEADPNAGTILLRSRLVIPFAEHPPPFLGGSPGQSHLHVYQYLDGVFHDVTKYFKEKGRMILHVLPTSEGEPPPLLRGGPSKGGRIHDQFVTLSIADQGARLPRDYLDRSDIWILQYTEGRFCDVTPHYMRRSESTLLLLPTLDGKLPPVPLLELDPDAGKILLRSRLVIPFAEYPLPFLGGSPGQSDLHVYQYLGRVFHDVTKYFKWAGRITLFLLPTYEQKVPDLLKRSPLSRCKLCVNPIRLMYADAGDDLPPDYHELPELWIIQYINGCVIDVTDYYKGRRLTEGRRIAAKLEDLRYSVSHKEYYPDYNYFGTPNGKPVFFPTPDGEILTQIGGSTVTAPLGYIAPNSVLRFDVSWMYDSGDGAWAEALLRTGGRDVVLFREYMEPRRGGKALRWKEVSADLRPHANQEAELVLRCSNEPGGNTVSDWLNWRLIVVEKSRGN